MLHRVTGLVPVLNICSVPCAMQLIMPSRPEESTARFSDREHQTDCLAGFPAPFTFLRYSVW